MIKSLVVKELTEHWASMVLIALFMCLGFAAVFMLILFATDSARPLDALRSFLMTFVVITSLTLGNRLVVKEYQSQTQLFLEALPMSRLGMIATKYIFGLLVILIPTLLIFGFVTVASSRSDDLTPRFLSILSCKTVGFTVLAYTFFFLMGLFGRYRVAIYILMLILAMMLDMFTKVEFGRLAPFVLLDTRFAYERYIFPTQDLVISVGLIVVGIILIGWLTAVREGNVAAMLAEKMSYREKIFISCLILGVLACFSVLDERVVKRPFDLPDAIVINAGITDVKMTRPGDGNDERAKEIVDSVSREVVTLVDYLKIETLPPVFLIQRSDLDPNQFERGDLENADGILIRANFYHSDWRQKEFLPWFAGELINAASGDRNMAESVRWVLDGFPFWWAEIRDYEYDGADSVKRDLRVAYAMQQGFARDDYNHWLSYRERIGRDVAEAMAWSGLDAILSATDEFAVQEFLRRILDPDVPADIRATIHLYLNSIQRVAKQELNMNESEIIENWISHADSIRKQQSENLESVPKISGSVEYEKISSGSRRVKYKFDCIPPPTDNVFLVKYTELTMFDFEMAESDEEVEVLSFDDHHQGSLTETFARSTRFMYTFAVYSETMGCHLITGWQREEMP